MNLINNDISRCSNESCVKKTICKRFLQLKIDKEKSKIENATFSFKGVNVSVCKFESKDCEKIIRV